MNDENLCRECKKPLPAGARKCTECATFQDWRRFIFTWSGVFTATLAIVPLWSGAISLWTLAFPEPAKVKLALASCKADGVLAYLTNVGGSPAMLGQPRISFPMDGRWTRFEMEFPMDEDDLLSEPDEIDIVTLSPPPEASFSTDDQGGCRLRVAFPVIGEEDEPGLVEAPCTCTA